MKKPKKGKRQKKGRKGDRKKRAVKHKRTTKKKRSERMVPIDAKALEPFPPGVTAAGGPVGRRTKLPVPPPTTGKMETPGRSGRSLKRAWQW